MKKAPYHVVNEVVGFAKHRKGERKGRFVNAVLRRFLREDPLPPLNGNPAARLSTAYSFPHWLVTRWLDRFGEATTETLLGHLNTPPLFTVRFDEKAITCDEVTAALKAKGCEPEPSTVLPNAVKVGQVRRVLDDDLFRKGLLTIQDEASQIAGSAVQPKPDDLVLDACAGTGTKTRNITESCPQARIIAMDSDRDRLAWAGPAAPLVVGDATRPPFRPETFNHILLDAPCTSLGIIRKHPELKWRRSAEDIRRFSGLQRRMLNTLWGALRRGGSLVYSVCSFEPEETTDLVKIFAEDRDFVLEKPTPFLFNKEYLLSVPFETGMDGFFVVKMRKL